MRLINLTYLINKQKMTGVNNNIVIDTHNESKKINNNEIMNQFDIHNLFDMNSTRTKKRYDQMQKRKAFLNNINNVNNVDNISENDIIHIDINQLEKTSHTTPLPPDEFINQSNNNVEKELSENVQIQSEINLNENNENVELNISNLDNSVEIHEEAENINNSNISDIKQIISKYHAKSKSFIQLNNNLVARAAIDNSKNTQSYMMALYPELFHNNNNNNRISVNNYKVEDIIKEENENDTYNSNNNQLNVTMSIANDNNNLNKKKHQRTSSAVIQKESVMTNVKNNNKNRNNYSHLDNYLYLYKLKTNNTKKKTKQNYLNYSLNIYRNKDTTNSNISLFISNKKKTILKNQKSNSTKIIFGKATKLGSIDKISSKPLNNSITTFPNKKDDSNKYSTNNNNIIRSYCSKEQIFTNLKKKYPNYNFTFTSPNYKNSTINCISPTSNPKLNAKLNNTNKIKVKLNLSQKINSIPFISSISSTNIKINSLNKSTNSSVSKQLITFALQRINFRPLSTYSYALSALNKSHKEMFCILVCNDTKNGEFLFRGLYEIIKNEHGEYVNAIKLFSYSYCSCKIVFKQIKHFYTIKTNKTKYEFCKYKPELKEFNEKVVLMM